MLAALESRLVHASLGARLFLVATLAITAHASALRAGFAWLDHAHLERGLALVPLVRLGSSFMGSFAGTGFYRPLMTLSLSVDAALSGAPWLYHVTNLAWHAWASMLAVVTAVRLGVSLRAATVAGLLFATHPLSSEVASGIAFRSEAMLAVGLLGLINGHLRQRPLLAAFALLGAALSKETALALGPLFVLALELGQGTRTRNWRLLAAESLACALALGLHYTFASPWSAEFPLLSRSFALGTRFAALAKSAGAFVWAAQPSVCDAFTVQGLLAPLSLLGLLLALFLANAGRQGGLRLLLALTLLPSLQLVPTLRWWSPHYLYVPLAFASMWLAQAAEARGRAWFNAVLLLTLGLGSVSWLDGKHYVSDTALWQREVDRNPACREGHFYLGEAARLAGDFSTAAQAYEDALRPRAQTLAFVDLQATLQNLGIARSELGQMGPAQQAFEAALQTTRDPVTRHEIRFNLAVLAARSRSLVAARSRKTSADLSASLGEIRPGSSAAGQ